MEVCSSSSETRLTIGNFEGDIEVATSITAHMSLTTDLDTHAILHSCGDIDIFFYESFLESLSMTVMTFLGYDLS